MILFGLGLVLLTCLELGQAYQLSGLFARFSLFRKQILLPDLYEASILELQSGLDAGHFTSVDLVNVWRQYIFNNSNFLGIFCSNRPS